MFTPPADQIEWLLKAEASYRFVHTSPTTTRNAFGEFEVSQRGRIKCEILDVPSGVFYAEAYDDESEPRALTKAIEAAKLAPKPLTAAQRQDPRYLAINGDGKTGAELAAENASLRKRLAELEGKSDSDAQGILPAARTAFGGRRGKSKGEAASAN